MRRIAAVAGGSAIGGSFYLLLVDTTDLPELYVLAGVTVAAALAFWVSFEQSFTEASIRPSWLARGWRVLARVPVHIWLVCRAALAQPFTRRPRRGVFRAIPFEGGHGRGDAGRRAVTEALGSLAPNTIVIGIDPDRGLLLVHQLCQQGGRDELDVLRLG